MLPNIIKLIDIARTASKSLIRFLKKCISVFNSTYDLFSRLVKVCFMLIALSLIGSKWYNINWSDSGNKLITQYVPLEFNKPAEAVAYRNHSTATMAPLSNDLAKLTSEPTPSKEAKQAKMKLAVKRGKGPDTNPTNLSVPKEHQTAHVPTGDAIRDVLNIYQYGQLVFTVSKMYDTTGSTITFDKLVQKGQPDFEKPFLYDGVEIRIVRIEQQIGLLVSNGTVEGPILRGVQCIVVRR